MVRAFKGGQKPQGTNPIFVKVLHDKMLFRSVSLLSGLDNKISKVLSCFIWGGVKFGTPIFQYQPISLQTTPRGWGLCFSCRGQCCPGHRPRPLGGNDVGWPDVWTINSIGYIIWSNYSDLTRPHPKWRKIPLFQGNLGWWNIIIWPDIIYPSSHPCNSRFTFQIQPFSVTWLWEQEYCILLVFREHLPQMMNLAAK